MSLRPDFCAPRLADVPLTALGGARVLLLDADNTLAPWRGAVPDPAAARWWRAPRPRQIWRMPRCC